LKFDLLLMEFMIWIFIAVMTYMWVWCELGLTYNNLQGYKWGMWNQRLRLSHITLTLGGIRFLQLERTNLWIDNLGCGTCLSFSCLLLTILPHDLKFETLNSANWHFNYKHWKKKGTKVDLLMDFLSKGKLNVNMGRSYENPRMRSFGSMTCLMNLPHKMKVSL
jgi:hypothetical protein